MKMKTYALLSAVMLSILFPFFSNAQIYSVVTCPGENSATQMNISFAADTAVIAPVIRFAKASEKEFTRSQEPEVSLCTAYNGIYSKNEAGDNIYEDRVFNKYSATLAGLEPDTEYKYIVCSDESGTSCEPHYFKTAGSCRWSAFVISDFHSYLPLPGRLVSAMSMLDVLNKKNPKADFVVSLGDIVAWGGSYSFWKRMYEEPYFHNYMWATLNGNHDNMSRKYELTSDYFRYANNVPANGYGDQVGVCYWFIYSDALFIMLNNEEMRSKEGLKAAREWVTEVLESHPDVKYRIVCEHYQWFSGERGTTSQYARWRDIFDKYEVDLALAGNNHIYVRSEAIEEGIVTDGSTGTVYLQTPSSDNERGSEIKGEVIPDNQDKIAMRWTEGGRTVGAMLLDANDNRLTVTLYDRNGKKLDKVRIPAKHRK